MLFPSIGLLVVIVVLLILSRLTSRALLKLLGEGWYIVLLWPGVIIHEGSHLFGAIFTLTPVRGFSVIPEDNGPSPRVLGFVRHDKPKNSLALIIVSGFPLIGGTLAIWLMTILLFPDLFSLISTVNWQVGIIAFLNSLVIFLKQTSEIISFNDWRLWLFIYLSLSIGAHLAPSNHDLKYVARGVIGLSVIFIIFYGVGRFIPTDIIHASFNWIMAQVNSGIVKILFVFVYPAIILIIASIASTFLFLLKKIIRGY